MLKSDPATGQVSHHNATLPHTEKVPSLREAKRALELVQASLSVPSRNVREALATLERFIATR